MTAKELLRERIETLTEDEAAEALELLETEIFADGDCAEREFPPAPQHIVELARMAVADADANRLISDEEFGHRLELD